VSIMILILGLTLAISIVVGSVRQPIRAARTAGFVAAGVVLVGAVLLSSVRYVSSDEVGIVVKNALGPKLGDGRVVAANGEMGVQADVLSPGWHLWYWPVVYDVTTVGLTEVPDNHVGLVKAIDGASLGDGQSFADPVDPETFQAWVQDAGRFLDEGGQRGQQINVLTTGTSRIYTRLFKVEMVSWTDVEEGTVVVLRSNFGDPPSVVIGTEDQGQIRLANDNEKGIRQTPLTQGKYPLNPVAFTVTSVSTRETIVDYTTSAESGTRRSEQTDDEQRAIEVITSDGFEFPIDVRVEYRIRPRDAPLIVARFGGDNENLQRRLHSATRGIFRNNAERVTGLDYVQQRSLQESQSSEMLASEMAEVGVTVTAVRIGRVVVEGTGLADLLKTQTDRKIAEEEKKTFAVQQMTAEQKKELSRAEQEAVEERRLATARYEVKIAEEDKRRRIIEAEAEAESIGIEAEAQSRAYQLIAEQIGKGNAALVEVLKIVGERGIEITPRVMVTGVQSDSGSSSGETTALIGTMLDSMVDRTTEPSGPRRSAREEGEDR